MGFSSPSILTEPLLTKPVEPVPEALEGWRSPVAKEKTVSTNTYSTKTGQLEAFHHYFLIISR